MDSPSNPLSVDEKEAEPWKQEPCSPHTEKLQQCYSQEPRGF